MGEAGKRKGMPEDRLCEKAVCGRVVSDRVARNRIACERVGRKRYIARIVCVNHLHRCINFLSLQGAWQLFP